MSQRISPNMPTCEPTCCPLTHSSEILAMASKQSSKSLPEISAGSSTYCRYHALFVSFQGKVYPSRRAISNSYNLSEIPFIEETPSSWGKPASPCSQVTLGVQKLGTSITCHRLSSKSSA